MAPDGSMTAQMLGHAIDMVHATGRKLVVEGIETAERLAQMRQIATGTDYAQGYFIARPLPVDRFAAFLAAHRARPALSAAKPRRATIGVGAPARPLDTAECPRPAGTAGGSARSPGTGTVAS